MSIIVEDKALEELKNILSERGITDKTVRVFVAGMGCSGPQLNLTVDEKTDEDVSVEAGDFTFVAEKGLIEQFGKFSVKFFDEDGQRGLYVEPEVQFSSGCSGCGGGCH